MSEEVEARVVVTIDVNDESAVTRATENVDGFRDSYYDLRE
jgi:hypothetical protein